MRDPIVVVDYDPRWPEIFESLRNRIATVLGNLAAAVEHVGSTSVPGLAAKPIIDMDVVLSSTTGLSPAIQRLGSVGYVHEGNLGIAGREAFLAPAADFAHHLYVCPPGCGEFARHLEFRDYLRTHPEAAKSYGGLKKHLADRYSQDRAAYVAGKGEFVANILAKITPKNCRS